MQILMTLLGKSTDILSVAAPAEPCGEKQLVFVQILGGEKLKCRCKYFKRPERGLKYFGDTFRIVFRILFRVFLTIVCIDFEMLSGAASFCRRAALTICTSQFKQQGGAMREMDFRQTHQGLSGRTRHLAALVCLLKWAVSFC